jgi:hypothetical protein
MRPSTTPPDEFAAIWNAAVNTVEVATATGLSIEAARTRAWTLRKEGYSLKMMPSGGRSQDSIATESEDRVPAKRPTDELPGTPGKVAVLCKRARTGQELWHAEDGRR